MTVLSGQGYFCGEVFFNTPIYSDLINRFLNGRPKSYFAFFTKDRVGNYPVIFFPGSVNPKEDIDRLEKYSISEVHFNQELNAEVIENLPGLVSTVIFHSNISKEIIKTLPKTVKNVGLHSPYISLDIIKALPTSVTAVSFGATVSAEQVQALHSKVINVTVPPEVSASAIKALPDFVTSLSFAIHFDNYVFTEDISEENVKVIPSSVISVTFPPAASGKTIRALPISVTKVVFARDILIEGKYDLAHCHSAWKQFYAHSEPFSSKLAALPKTVNTVSFPPTVLIKEIRTLAKRVSTIYRASEPHHDISESQLYDLLAALPSTVTTIISASSIFNDSLRVKELVSQKNLTVQLIIIAEAQQENLTSPFLTSTRTADPLPSISTPSSGGSAMPIAAAISPFPNRNHRQQEEPGQKVDKGSVLLAQGFFRYNLRPNVSDRMQEEAPPSDSSTAARDLHPFFRIQK